MAFSEKSAAETNDNLHATLRSVVAVAVEAVAN